jgi:hypothetical protein
MSYQIFQSGEVGIAIDGNGEPSYLGVKSLASICSLGLEKPLATARLIRAVEELIRTGVVPRPKEGRILGSQGLIPVTLIPRELGDAVIRWHNPHLYREMAGIGSRVFLRRLCRLSDR